MQLEVCKVSITIILRKKMVQLSDSIFIPVFHTWIAFYVHKRHKYILSSIYLVETPV